MARVLSSKFLSTFNITADVGDGAGAGTINKQVGRSKYSVTVGATTGEVELVDGGTPGVGEAVIEVKAFGDTSGSGATATVDALVLASVVITDGGEGYTLDDVLTIDGGTGTAATITVTEVDGSGVITAVEITEAGEYTELPTSPNAATGGTGTTPASFTLSFGLGTITVTDAGSGYDNATATVDGNAVLDITLVDGEVTEIVASDIGSDYTEIPTITITAGQDVEYAKTILRNIVHTFDGNTYKWKYNVAASATGEADVG